VLLQRRVMMALAARLTEPSQKRDTSPAFVPERMQTGREGERAGKRPRLMVNTEPERAESALPESPPAIKGFEDPVLVRGLGEALSRLRTDVEWVASVWEDIVAAKE